MTDLKRTRGDTHPVVRVVKSSETKATVDISTWTILISVSTKPFPADAASLVFSVTANITDGPNGEYQWAPTDAMADNIGRMFFGVLATKPTEKETLEAGLYTVIEGRK